MLERMWSGGGMYKDIVYNRRGLPEVFGVTW